MRRQVLVSVSMLVYFTVQIPAQQSRSTVLAVRVGPESKLIPEQVPIRFLVPADNEADSINQTVAVEAWVRRLPGERIRVTAVLIGLQGPDGPVPASAVRWSGSNGSATGGGLAASCSSGTFASDKPQDIVLNWQESGTIICSLTFSLTGAVSQSPGVYTGTVSFVAN
jgi:hypothetical protein